MEYLRQRLRATALCLLLTSIVCEANFRQRVCSVTKGNMLTSFLRARQHLLLPCRYIVGEFRCQTRTQVIAHNSRASDGNTFVAAVTIRKSRADQADDYDEISVSMDDFGQFLDQGDGHKKHGANSFGEDQSRFPSAEGHLHGAYDPTTDQAVLADDAGNLHVHLGFVDQSKDRAKVGNLTVVCSDPDMSGVQDSPSYFCGNVGSGSEKGDSKTHLKEAATRLKLSMQDYITYTMLMDHNVQQTDARCQQAVSLTRSCFNAKAVIGACGRLLNPRSFKGKCIRTGTVDPLSAYVNCVSWQCTRDWSACVKLGDVLKPCEKGRKMLKMLPCVTSGGY